VHEEEDWPPEDDLDEILEDMFDQATHQGDWTMLEVASYWTVCSLPSKMSVALSGFL
jgi:hypothetical protein